MKIAVIGSMNAKQQLVIDKMIEEGHEIVYMTNSETISPPPDFYVIDESSEFDTTMFSTVGIVRELQWKVNIRPPKPYYRQKEKW